MVWVKLDDRFAEHPKVIALSDKAFRLHVSGLCWCGRNLSDGALPKNAHLQLGGTAKALNELIAAGLWRRAVAGGFLIHDYLKFNPTAEDVEAAREQRRAAGRSSAQKRWGNSGEGNDSLNEPLNESSNENGNGVVTKPMPQYPVPSPEPFTTGSNTFFPDLDIERARELDRIMRRLRDADAGSAGVIGSYGRQLPFGALAKVRESVELQRGKVATGWVVNALKSEIAERAA